MLVPGVVVRVPSGAKHKIFNVTEALMIYDVFQPATLYAGRADGPQSHRTGMENLSLKIFLKKIDT